MPLTTSIDDLLTAASQAAAASSGGTGTSAKPVYTGRYIAIFKPDATADAIQQFLTNASVKAASATSFDAQAVSFGDLGDAEVLRFPSLGLALVSADAYAALQPPNNNAAVASADGTVPAGTTTGPAADSPLDSWEQETFFYADDGTATATPADPSTATPADPSPATPADPSTAATANVTCGLDITQVAKSTNDGSGIKLCVLDTGIDLNHPDFSGRTIVSFSFIPGQAVQDGHSHGTHTAGTAAGPKAPASGPRYGIAYNASLYIGKVLSDGGAGVGGSVIAGMNWALANNCDVISMSLEAPVGVQKTYTQLGQKALDQKSLIIAAAGNDSSRPGTVANTGAPANSPTVMAVAGVDCSLNMYTRSNGGKIEIAGPGVDVLSSVPMPTQYGTKSGTSMATPHVSGIAALWAQSDANLRGQALWTAVTGVAKSLGQPATDVGAGLVQAPIPGGVCQ
jgi:subtilisin